MTLRLRVDGRDVEAPDDGGSVLDLLRDQLGVRSVKDGCSPQGQCGCCTVLIDGQPRVSCVTPARRVNGRSVTTLDGFAPETRERWAAAFAAAGASQCGFCTPGILVRLATLGARPGFGPEIIERALTSHLCRCTGWRTIVDAALDAAGAVPAPPSVSRDWRAAAERARLEGGVAQRVGEEVVLGRGGFAEDTAPPDALVAVPDPAGGWGVGETLREARAVAAKVQGRRTTRELAYPVELPSGDWALRLRTTWVEPAYVEPDASWCEPGGEPASPVANGGAFGGKLASIAPQTARELADRFGRPVRVVLSREDVVRVGPKRPPLAAGVRSDGSGVVRVLQTAGIADAIHSVAPQLEVVEVAGVCGPPTSARLRAAGWAEAAVVVAVAERRQRGGGPVLVRAPNGSRASARVASDSSIEVDVACGDPLDEVVLRSYCVGAAHQALGWVTSEGIAVDENGEVHDLTIRSFGIVPARSMPDVRIRVTGGGEPVNGSDAVFAAVAAAVWIERGLPAEWPTDRRGRG